MMRRAFSLLAATTILTLVAAACSASSEGDSEDESTPPAGDSTTVTPTTGAARVSPLYDPPLEFAEEEVHIGHPWGGEYTVHGATAYYFPLPSDDVHDLTAVDLATGTDLWSVPVDTGEEEGGSSNIVVNAWRAPIVAQVDDRAWVFVAFPAVEVGSGTQPDRQLTRVLALDAADGSTQWMVDYDYAEVGIPHLVAVTGDTLMLASSGTDSPFRDPIESVTIAVAAASGDEQWRESGFLATSVDPAAVVGTVRGERRGDRSPQAHAMANGEQLWSADHLVDMIDLGPGLVAFRVFDRRGSTDETRIVSSETGQILASIDVDLSCVDEERSVVVCWNHRPSDDDQLAGFDRETGQLLWELVEGDSTDRVVPEVLATRPGVVYARGPRGVVVLDARTGEDLVDDLASFPGGRVVPGFALVSRNGVLYAYPAIG